MNNPFRIPTIMKLIINFIAFSKNCLILCSILFFLVTQSIAQEIHKQFSFDLPNAEQRMADSLIAASIPLLEIPPGALKPPFPIQSTIPLSPALQVS